ncbi:MAG: hypothetical protein ACJAYB_000002 [Psychromonas sp.]|jgi:hypothetical protein
MTFDLLKEQSGQAISEIVDILLDKCRHTTAQSVIDGTITTSSAISSSATAVTIAVTGGTPINFINADPYILWDDELISVTIIDNLTIQIDGRSKFGTVNLSHSAGSVIIKHSGEVDGSCRSFPQTCSAPDSFLEGLSTTFRFPSCPLPLGEKYHSGLLNYRPSGAKVDPGESMGSSARANITIQSDTDYDSYVPYPGRRTNLSNLFAKLEVRNPYFEGRPVKTHVGFDPKNFNLNNYQTDEYLIDDFQLSEKNVATLSLLDPLMLTEETKAQAPAKSLGTVVSNQITSASTTIQYTSAPALDYGVVGSSPAIRIDSEVIRVTVASDFVLNIIERGIGGTKITDHEINSTVQQCLEFAQVNVVVIIQTIMNLTTIPTRFFDNYTDAINATSSILITRIISKPTSIKKLINELVKIGDLTMFYSSTASKIRIKPVTDASAGVISLNDNEHFKARSLNFKRKPKQQYTRHPVAWASNDITKDSGIENYSIVFSAVEVGVESPTKKGDVNEKEIFFNNWLTTSNNDVTIGAAMSQRVIDRSVEIPVEVDFILDVTSVGVTQGSVLELGTIVSISSDQRVELDGTTRSRNYQLISLSYMGNMQYKCVARLFQDPLLGVTIDFIIDANKENYDLSSEYSPPAGNYIILIDTGVVIGATTTAHNAFTTGSQAPGVTFEFIIRGSMFGAGGRGGAGGQLLIPQAADVIVTSKTELGTDGLPGGNVFVATVDCSINVGAGAIWSGGGAAGGGKSVGQNTPSVGGTAGNGGSGGQGYIGGNGHSKGTVELDGSSGFVDEGLDGQNGSVGSPGSVGVTSGGVWGAPGDNQPGSTGGQQGFAIVSNGNTVTITSGDNNLNIRGLRS